MADYRPTVADMTDSSKWQALSCSEGGKHDWEKWGKAKAKAKAQAQAKDVE